MKTTYSSRIRRIVATATASLVIVGLAGCAGGSSEADAGFQGQTIRVGVAEGGLPVVNGDAGAEPEMAKLVLEKLGVADIEWVPMEFSALIPSLQSGRIDMAPSGLYITAERCKAVSFAEPSIFYSNSIAVPKGNPVDLNTFQNLVDADATVATVTGSVLATQLKEAGVPNSQISEFPDINSALDALNVGRVQAFPYDGVSLGYKLLEPTYSNLELSEPIIPVIDGVELPYGSGAAFPRDAAKRAEEYSDAQAELLAEGAFDEIFTTYGMTDTTTNPTPRPTVADYCEG